VYGFIKKLQNRKLAKRHMASNENYYLALTENHATAIEKDN
jgi:hypothetical protein